MNILDIKIAKLNLLGCNIIQRNSFGISYKSGSKLKLLRTCRGEIVEDTKEYKQIKILEHFILVKDTNNKNAIYVKNKKLSLINTRNFNNRSNCDNYNLAHYTICMESDDNKSAILVLEVGKDSLIMNDKGKVTRLGLIYPHCVNVFGKFACGKISYMEESDLFKLEFWYSLGYKSIRITLNSNLDVIDTDGWGCKL